MWKLSRRGAEARPRSRASSAAVAALVLIGALTLPASITLACDDDYREPVGYVPYQQPGPTVVVVDPRGRDDRYDYRRREHAERRYWYWRGREQAHQHRHHQDRDRRW
jgi:hypothetical protein